MGDAAAEHAAARHYGMGIGEDQRLARPHRRAARLQHRARTTCPSKKAAIVVMVNSDIPVGKANPAPTIVKALRGGDAGERAGVGGKSAIG